MDCEQDLSQGLGFGAEPLPVTAGEVDPWNIYPESPTMRGLSAPSGMEAGFLDPGFEDAGGFFGLEPPDLGAKKSVALCSSDFGDLSFGGDDKLDPFFSLEPPLGVRLAEDESSCAKTNARFTAQAPSMPVVEGFRLEVTTLRASDVTASDLANTVLDFLNSKVRAVVTKVSLAKLAVKAQVFHQATSCVIKARVYHAEHHFLEFQRRSGDHVCFQAIFAEAVSFFSSRFGDAVTPPVLAPPPQPVPQLEEQAEQADDLLQLMRFANDPLLQVDVAAALAAADEAALQQLCEDASAPDACQALLEAGRLEVTYPTALLLKKLAALPEGARRLQRSSLPPVMQACAEATSADVLRVELEGALKLVEAA